MGYSQPDANLAKRTDETSASKFIPYLWGLIILDSFRFYALSIFEIYCFAQNIFDHKGSVP